MIIYSVKIILEKSLSAEWLEWMKKVHIPNVLNTGYFFQADIYETIEPNCGNEKESFVVEYKCRCLQNYFDYVEKHSEKMRSEHNEKYQGKFSAERIVKKFVQSISV